MGKRLARLETNVDRFTGSLEHFLGMIRIDDGLCLVRDNRRIGSVDPATITPNLNHDAADDNVIITDPTMSKPDPLVSDRMVISDDDEGPSDIPLFVAGTASTPSDTLGDNRMDMPVGPLTPPFVPDKLPPAPPPPVAVPEALPSPQAAGSGNPAPPPHPHLPPPTVNLIPATPQTSQEKAEQPVVPQCDPSPTHPVETEPTRPRDPTQEPSREPSRGPSRTPVGTLGLRPPMTRSRSRSKTPL